jgi:hypothetical protein
MRWSLTYLVLVIKISISKNVISTILDICTINSYENVTNYEWLICHVIFSIAKIKEQKHYFEENFSNPH